MTIQELFAAAGQSFAARDKARVDDRHLRVQAEALLDSADPAEKAGLELIIRNCPQAGPEWGLFASELIGLSSTTRTS